MNFLYNSCPISINKYVRDCYWQKWGAGYFYEQDDAFKAYDARLSYILNYKGATSGKVWKNWPEAIFSFNLQVSESIW